MGDIAVTLKVDTAPYRKDTLEKIPFGNFGDDFNFTIQTAAGAAHNITGTIPKFTLYRVGIFGMRQAFQKDCTIDSGAGGTCHYTVASGDFIERVIYFARIELYTGTTKIESTQDFMLEVV